MLPIAWNTQDSLFSGLCELKRVHSYRDNKVVAQRIVFVLSEIYRNIMIQPMWTRTWDLNTKKFVTTNQVPPSQSALLKASRSLGFLGHEPPVSLHDPAINLLLQSPMFWLVWSYCVLGTWTYTNNRIMSLPPELRYLSGGQS